MTIFRSPAYRYCLGSGGVSSQESVNPLWSSAQWGHSAFIFPKSVDSTIYFKIAIPLNYGSEPALIMIWSSGETSAFKNSYWDFSASSIGGNDSESLNGTTDETLINNVFNAPFGVAHYAIVDSISLTPAVYGAGDTVLCSLMRHGTHVSDNMLFDAHLQSILFEYNDDFD